MSTTSRFGLTEETIEAISAVLTNHKIRTATLYGSRAKGTFRDGSDIDLVIMDPGLSTAELLRIETELDDLLLPQKIDLSLYDQIDNDELRAHIQRVGLVFK